MPAIVVGGGQPRARSSRISTSRAGAVARRKVADRFIQQRLIDFGAEHIVSYVYRADLLIIEIEYV